MAQYLLDSNAIIDFVKLVPSVVLTLRELLITEELCVCDIVLNEVLAGTFPHAEARTRNLLDNATYLQTSRRAAERAGRMRFELYRRGITLSLPDSLIAATASDHRATVVTKNVKDFQPTGVALLVPG